MGEIRLLRRLAAECGVQTAYLDCEGRRRVASADVLVSVLRSLGLPIEDVAGAGRALRQVRESRGKRCCPPVLVAWNGRLRPFPIQRPRHRTGDLLSGTLQLEGGDQLTCGFEATSDAGGSELVVLQVPRILPLGVHLLELESRSFTATATVLSAPARCFGTGQDADRELGLFLPLYALHDARTWGVGDLRALGRLQRWAASLGCQRLGTLPLLACFLDEPFDPSPYAPVTRLYWNELFLDLGSTPELEHSPAARALLSSTDFKEELQDLRAGSHVDYRRAAALKRQVLEALAGWAFQQPRRRKEIEAWVETSPHLDEYARFRSTVERRGQRWQQWPAHLRRGKLAREEGDPESWQRHVYAQFLLCRQLEMLSADRSDTSLYLDLPIGVHEAGFDTWLWQDQFVHGVSVGAPPDPFFSRGQNWGFPPPHPRTTRRAGHRYFRLALRAHLRFAGMLRLDHVMSLHRLFWIPKGFPAAEGVYVRYPYRELYGLLCLESHRSRSRIVGEDLGTVPREVKREMNRRGLLSMSVAQFQFRADPKDPIAPAQRQALATVNTHDMPPWKAFWDGSDIDLRRSLGLLEGQIEAHVRDRKKLREALSAFFHIDDSGAERISARVLAALLHLLASGPALEVAVNLEDLWLEECPHNVPGVEAYPSWRRKSSRSLERVMAENRLASLLEELSRLRRNHAIL